MLQQQEPGSRKHDKLCPAGAAHVEPECSSRRACEAASETDTASVSSGREQSPDTYALDADKDSPEVRFSTTVNDSGKPAGYGSSGYAIPGNENGRRLLAYTYQGQYAVRLEGYRASVRGIRRGRVDQLW